MYVYWVGQFGGLDARIVFLFDRSGRVGWHEPTNEIALLLDGDRETVGQWFLQDLPDTAASGNFLQEGVPANPREVRSYVPDGRLDIGEAESFSPQAAARLIERLAEQVTDDRRELPKLRDSGIPLWGVLW